MKKVVLFIVVGMFLVACESEQKRLERETQEEEYAKEEEERERREIKEMYGNNALKTGEDPYRISPFSGCSVNSSSCALFEVKNGNKNDIIIILVSNDGDEVISCRYVPSGQIGLFHVRRGKYLLFGYFGKGWYPYKEITGKELMRNFRLYDYGSEEDKNREKQEDKERQRNSFNPKNAYENRWYKEEKDMDFYTFLDKNKIYNGDFLESNVFFTQVPIYINITGSGYTFPITNYD